MPPSDRTSPALAFLIETIGEDATALLVSVLGGSRVYIPESLGDGHHLSQLLGRGQAQRLVKALGKGDFAVPLARMWLIRRRIRENLQHDTSPNRIARLVGCSERTVRREAARCRGQLRRPGKSNSRPDRCDGEGR